MDVLNPSPSLCLPQTMWLCQRIIMDSPNLTTEEVLSRAVPSSLQSRTPSDGAHAKRALAGLIEFRLVQRASDGRLSTRDKVSAGEFVRRLRHQLVVPPSSIGEGFAGAPDLRAGLVWLMRQSPTQPLNHQSVEIEMPPGLFTNDTRWNAFRWWSKALGFSQPAMPSLAHANAPKGRIVPNPAEAVLDAIREPFGAPLPRNERLPISQLLSFLRTEIPVLPGHESATVEGLELSRESEFRVLGAALSSAEHRGLLEMSYQSDPSGVLALPDALDHGRDRYISSVTIKG